MPRKVQHFTTAQVAHLFGWSTQHVRRLVKEEGLPVLQANNGRGGNRYNGPDVLKWYVEKRAKVEQGTTLADHNNRIAAARAEALERQNAVEAGKLCYVEDVRTWGENAVAILISSIDGLGRLSHELAANTDPNGVQVKLEDEGRAILDKFASEWTKYAESFGHDENAGGTGKAKAKA